MDKTIHPDNFSDKVFGASLYQFETSDNEMRQKKIPLTTKARGIHFFPDSLEQFRDYILHMFNLIDLHHV